MLLGGKNQGVVVVGCRLFKIMVSLYWIYFTVAPVSALRLTILVDFLINALLYKFYLGGTEVLYA